MWANGNRTRKRPKKIHRMLNKICFIGLFVILSVNKSLARPDSLLTERKLFGVSGGLGISMIRAADIVDYINLSFSPTSPVADFASAPEFFITANMQLSQSWGVGVEYAYLIHSYNVDQGGIGLTFDYNVHMPTIMVDYLYTGTGYILKLGGGIGYHFAKFSQYFLSSTTDYTADGIGMKLRAEGNTAFDEHLFGSIGADIRGDYLGELKNKDTNKPLTGSNGKTVNMNFVSFGLKFGLAYYF